MKVEQLETWAGPGQAKALATGLAAIRGDLAALRRVQGQHTAMLTTLQTDVGGLKTDVGGLKADVGGLKADVATLQADVATLQADVAELKTDMADIKTTLGEVLRRLPPA